MRIVTAAAKAAVRENAPGLWAEKHWGLPWYVGKDLVLRMDPFTHHVGVEFWRGSTVADPDHLLEGTGKNLRHAKIHTAAAARSPEFARLLRAAVELDRVEPKRPR